MSLKSGGGECLLYTTLCGSVGILVPFTSLEDHSFFQSLEMHIRKEYSSFCGRDHSSFRSYYYPLKVSSLIMKCEMSDNVPDGIAANATHNTSANLLPVTVV